MNISSPKTFAYGAIFVLVLCSNVGQAQLIPIFDWVMSFFGNYEEPTYTFIRNVTDTGSIEERKYPAKKWICTEEILASKVKDTKRSEMFMRLHKYMQGENEADQKLEMTVPVITKVAKVNPRRDGDLFSYEMCFFIPEEFQRYPPEPITTKVRVVSFPDLHVYSQRFGGYSTQEMEQEQMLSLASTLRNISIPYLEKSEGPRATHFICGYDSPTKFWNRRNEVWLLAEENNPVPVNSSSTDE